MFHKYIDHKRVDVLLSAARDSSSLQACALPADLFSCCCRCRVMEDTTRLIDF
ncbi:MAG: hypothetical protein JWQ49_1405 [Edaphobacter sp.]|nr:hypothetical protein [Edaphobacter sp.]